MFLVYLSPDKSIFVIFPQPCLIIHVLRIISKNIKKKIQFINEKTLGKRISDHDCQNLVCI